MSAPALIYLAISILGLGMTWAKNGEPKDGKHSLGVHLIGCAIAWGLLYWGGFFDRVAA